MKKIVALVLSLVMVLGLATVASAACTESICSERAGRRGEAVGRVGYLWDDGGKQPTRFTEWVVSFYHATIVYAQMYSSIVGFVMRRCMMSWSSSRFMSSTFARSWTVSSDSPWLSRLLQ